MASPKIFLSAGEASGEHYGALLMAEIRRLAPQAEFFGLGGTRMAELGLRRIVRAEDVAVMGITEVILHMAHIYAEYRKLKASLRAERPDIAILIDFPDVNLRLAAELRRLHIPVVYFVSPQLWAWKKWRMRRVKRNVTPDAGDLSLRRGVLPQPRRCRRLCRPSAGRSRPAHSDPGGVCSRKRPGCVQILGWLAAWKPHQGAARQLAANARSRSIAGSGIRIPLAGSAHSARIRRCGQWPGRPKGVAVRVVHDARAVLQHARASVVASGTATVEAALIGNPFLVVYRVSRVTYAVAQTGGPRAPCRPWST